MKLKVSPTTLKLKCQTPEAKKQAEELENINWKIQELMFETHKLQIEYQLKNLSYLNSLGYELEEKDEETIKALKEELESYGSTVQD